MKLFKNKRNKDSDKVTQIKIVTQTGNGLYTYGGDVYKSDIVRSCIRPLAAAVGKLSAKHIRDTTNSNQEHIISVNPEPYMRILLTEPNPLMSMQKLLEKLANQLELNSNAFALIMRDANGYPIAIYPIPCVQVNAQYSKSGDLYLKFLMRNGKSYTFDYQDVIHLRSDFYANDVFGTPKSDTLLPLMDIVQTTDQGIVKAIKNSNIVQWLIKYASAIRPDDIKKNAEKFVKDYLDVSTESVGVAATDGKADIQRVEPKDYVPNAEQMDRTSKRIYAAFSTNEKIIHSNYTEDEWNSYYESKIEPIAIDLANEFTRKLFTRRERGCGNRIVFEAANLACASISTKLNLVQMVDRGALTPNEWRATLNLAPLSGGDKPIRRLDTAVVTTEGGE